MIIYSVAEFDSIVSCISSETGLSVDYIYDHYIEFPVLADCFIQLDISFD